MLYVSHPRNPATEEKLNHFQGNMANKPDFRAIRLFQPLHYTDTWFSCPVANVEVSINQRYIFLLWKELYRQSKFKKVCLNTKGLLNQWASTQSLAAMPKAFGELNSGLSKGSCLAPRSRLSYPGVNQHACAVDEVSSHITDCRVVCDWLRHILFHVNRLWKAITFNQLAWRLQV